MNGHLADMPLCGRDDPLIISLSHWHATKMLIVSNNVMTAEVDTLPYACPVSHAPVRRAATLVAGEPSSLSVMESTVPAQ